jgi:hypothetical protein
MTFLLDVNVLIALIDPGHNFHDAAHRWLTGAEDRLWATCPMTENGALRIIGNPRYRNFPGSPIPASEALSDLRSLKGHSVWPDDISILDQNFIDFSRLLTSGQITDSYLLALAVGHGGQLATFDRRLITDAVRNGAQGLHLIGPGAEESPSVG